MTESETNLIGIGEIGLEVRGMMDELRRDHRQPADEVTGKHFETKPLTTRRVDTFGVAPNHKCPGHSAPARFVRSLEQADRPELGLPLLRRIAEKVEVWV